MYTACTVTYTTNIGTEEVVTYEAFMLHITTVGHLDRNISLPVL